MNSGTIVYVGNFDAPDRSAAGKRVFGNALVLERLGFEVVLIGKSSAAGEDFLQCSERIRFCAFPDYGMLRCAAYTAWLDRFLKENGISPCGIIRYGSPALAWFDFLLYRYAGKAGIPLIVDVVDWLNADGPNLLFNLAKAADTFMEKAVLNRLGDGVISVSTCLDGYYSRHFAASMIVPPLVQSYAVPLEGNETVRFIYAGSPFRKGVRVRNPRKIKDRLDIAVACLAKLAKKRDDFVFDIYGLTETEYLTAFPQHGMLLARSGGRIVFHGNRPMAEVQERVREADFSILLRHVSRGTMAGFPTKVVESLSCGTPVITTDTSDLRKYIRQNENGTFVNIEDEDALCGEIGSLIDMPRAARSAMKRSCFKRQDFVARAYADAFEEFLKRSGVIK